MEITAEKFREIFNTISRSTPVKFYNEKGVPIDFTNISFEKIWDELADIKERELAIRLGEVGYLTEENLLEFLLEYAKKEDVSGFITEEDLLQILLEYVKKGEQTGTPEMPDISDLRAAIEDEMYARENAVSNLQTQINNEKNVRITADSNLQTAIENEAIERENAVSNLQNNLNLKENIANKSNEIDDSVVLYPTNNAVNSAISQINNNLQNLSDLIPYITQSKGQSTTDIMSQKAVSEALDYLQTLIENIEYVDGEPTGNPAIDLSEYAKNEQVHSAIFDVAGDLVDINTADKTSLVGAINENKNRIDNNVVSITGLQSDLSGISGNIADLQSQINTINTVFEELETLLSEV